MVSQVRDLLPIPRYENRRVNNWSGKEHVRHVVLVDAHALIRLALRHVVAAFKCTTHVTTDLSTIHELLAVADSMTGRIIVLGPSIPISDCLTLMKRLRERRVRCEVIAIQQDLHPETARTLVEQGVRGLLDESASERDLAQAIATASLGNTFLSQKVRNILTAALPSATNHLTGREIQVLSRLKYGESNFRIAHVLGLKEKTIEKYLTNIYDKLNVHSRAEAILCLQKMHF